MLPSEFQWHLKFKEHTGFARNTEKHKELDALVAKYPF